MCRVLEVSTSSLLRMDKSTTIDRLEKGEYE